MDRDKIQETLFLPLQHDWIPISDDHKAIACNLRFPLPSSFKNSLTIIQPWRDLWHTLSAQKFKTYPNFQTLNTENCFDFALLKLESHRRYHENCFINLIHRLKPKGWIIICGHKTSGIVSFQKWVERFLPISGHYAKNHAVVFWLQQPDFFDFSEIDACYHPSYCIEQQFQTPAGSFSAQKIDTGSKILSQYFSQLSGKVADFGAGWGYLAYQALRSSSMITHIDLYEAYHDALFFAEKNLESLTTNVTKNFYWLDIVQEPISDQYDWIISNPPFHQGKKQNFQLGQIFIEKAAQALKRKGHLLMVANTHLPYEAIIKKYFKTSQLILQQHGYKIILAQK